MLLVVKLVAVVAFAACALALCLGGINLLKRLSGFLDLR